MSSLSALLMEHDMAEKIHRHNFFFALAIKKGEGEHQIDFKNFPVKDCSLFIIRPGQVHQLSLKRGTTGYLMGFDSGFYSPQGKQEKQAFREACFNNYYSLDAQHCNKLFSLLEGIFYEYSNKQIMFKESIRANLDLIFIELFRQTKISKILNIKNSHNQGLFEELIEMIEIHFFEKKQVAFYAEMLNLTPYQLNAITKNFLGQNCSHLINERIILEAKRSLMATSIQVKEIAYHLGYESPSYFIRFFKKNTGLTPDAFRKNFK